MEQKRGLVTLAQTLVKSVGNGSEQMMEVFSKVHARLQRLWQIRESDIPIIKISHEVEDVAEVFARLNQEGTRVREADVVLALAAVRNPGWVREEYLPFRSDLEEMGWELDAGVFVRTMTGIGKGRARLIEVPKDFWKQENLPPVWNATKETVFEVLKRLAEFGIASADLLPSTNSLIPLFVMHHKWGNEQSYRFEKALHWFLMANRDGRYSGSAITSLNEDVRTITESPSFEQAVQDLRNRLRVSPDVAEDDFLNRYDRAGNRFLRLMLYLVLFRHEARDWVANTRIGYDKSGALIATGFEPQWHHIFPRSMLRKAQIDDDHIHFLANITVINERTNVNKLTGKEPSKYIEEFKVSEESLVSHLIPQSFAGAVHSQSELRRQWDVKQYDQFLLDRAQLLAKEANVLLHSLEGL